MKAFVEGLQILNKYQRKFTIGFVVGRGVEKTNMISELEKLANIVCNSVRVAFFR